MSFESSKPNSTLHIQFLYILVILWLVINEKHVICYNTKKR